MRKLLENIYGRISNYTGSLYRTLFKPILYFERIRLENSFVDFLSILLVMESCGLRIYDVFNEAIKGSLNIPKPYLELARVYNALSRAIPDPYTCLRKLAFLTTSPRLRSFLLNYSDILLSSGDTFKLIDYWIKEEILGLKSKIDNYVKLIDSIYESYLILVLGVTIYFMLPITLINPVFFSLILVVLSITAYLLVLKLMDAIGLEFDIFTRYGTFWVVVITPLIIPITWNHIVTIHIVIMILFGLILYYLTEPFRLLELEVFNLLEKVYSEVRLGQPIDLSFIKSAKDSYILKNVSNLLVLGLRSSEALSLVGFKGFYRRVLDMLLAPIEYARSGVEHVGYVLSVVENVFEFRRVLCEKSRVYYIYVFLTLSIMFLAVYSLSSLGLGLFNYTNKLILRNVVYTTLIECFILASCFRRGYWYGSIMSYVTLLLIYFAIFLF
ncbi:MAG: hypothetical protein QXO78_01490 [Desulfurococcaceae archaeon]